MSYLVEEVKLMLIKNIINCVIKLNKRNKKMKNKQNFDNLTLKLF